MNSLWIVYFIGGGPLPDLLQRADIRILTQAECVTFWDSYINDGHICIFRLEDNESGACHVSINHLLISVKVKYEYALCVLMGHMHFM